jgi:hypothetical protein
MFYYFMFKDPIMPTTATRKQVIPSAAEGSGPLKRDSSAALRSARNDGQARKSGWSPERRAKQAAAIKIWAPWAKSTGPLTAIGKKVSAMNALKHGGRARRARLISAALRRHSLFLKNVKTYTALTNNFPANELLKSMGENLVMEGWKCIEVIHDAVSAETELPKTIKRPANAP